MIIFLWSSLTKKLKSCLSLELGCKILVHPVSKPELYGVAITNKKNRILSIKKSLKFKSNLYITGLYFDNKVVNYSKTLRPLKEMN